MKATTDTTIPQPILDALVSEVMLNGMAFMRMKFVDGLYHLEVIGRAESHCSTCQCNRVHAEMPSHPVEKGVKRTKSWHHG